MDEKSAKKELKKGYKKAKKLIKDESEIELFLQRLEDKLKEIPKIGETLSMVPTLISLVRSYIKKEYTKVPLGTIIAIVSALIYIFTPLDTIPDSLPVLGFIDDALVIGACLKLVKSDVDEYQRFKDENNLK